MKIYTKIKFIKNSPPFKRQGELIIFEEGDILAVKDLVSIFDNNFTIDIENAADMVNREFAEVVEQ